MSRRWSEATTQEFVRMYLKRGCLWNTAESAYKDKRARDAAYLAIAEEFQDFTGLIISTCDVKRKIKNLRTTYSQQLQKITSQSRDPTHIYQPSLVWFQQMDSCLKHLVVRPTRQSEGEGEFSQLSEEEPSERKLWVKPVEEAVGDHRPDPLVTHVPALAAPPAVTAKRRRSSAFQHVKVKKKKAKSERESPGYHSASDAERAEEPRLEDEFDVFGKYIAAQMRRMRLHKALRLQMEINRLVGGARLAETSDQLDTD